LRKVVLMPVLAVVLTATMLIISAASVAGWQQRSYDVRLRETVGLPSIAIGTNYEGTRNPLIEVFVRSLYDIPGGYDYVVPSSFIDTPLWLREYHASVPGFNMTGERG